ncbi:hypothetical protein SMD44_p10199 (plasmid) [Streptomyces alboflavus]|uniref:Uncharacterized protein n=1 Tax=Streptomyces alboflavus TaxID=67267 RepID=A0A291W3V7_9ACTN|nr:hypothetical protein [Streptomyces alboflavus]ATM24698.1 hypothetical protein SMD44_p10199 [Streptomyces alboflavus]
MPTSIDTAVHFHPSGTPGRLCNKHNRQILAVATAQVARLRGYDQTLSDEEIMECIQVVKGGRYRYQPQPATFEAVRSALRAPLATADTAEDIKERVFTGAVDQGHPVLVQDAEGHEYYVIAIPATP